MKFAVLAAAVDTSAAQFVVDCPEKAAAEAGVPIAIGYAFFLSNGVDAITLWLAADAASYERKRGARHASAIANPHRPRVAAGQSITSNVGRRPSSCPKKPELWVTRLGPPRDASNFSLPTRSNAACGAFRRHPPSP